MGIPVKREMQRDIACYEALAQAGWLILADLCPCSRVPIRLCSVPDNVGAEAGINNTFTTSRPLAYFLEHIALLSAMFHVLLDVNHIPAALNTESDALSRPAEKAHPLDCTCKPLAASCTSVRFTSTCHMHVASERQWKAMTNLAFQWDSCGRRLDW